MRGRGPPADKRPDSVIFASRGDESDGLLTASHGHSSPANHGTSFSVVALALAYTSNLRSPKSARAAQGRTALVAALIAVVARTISLTDSTRRGRSHHHDGSKGVKIKVNLLAVRVMFNDDYACNRLYVSDICTRCARP